MIAVPLNAVPSQKGYAVLANQNAQISVYQKRTGLYFDLSLNSVPVVTARMCLNLNRLLLGSNYTGFVGDFCFVDTQGSNDPDYTGLGGRYTLLYLEASDLAVNS